MPDILGIAEVGMQKSLRQLDAISNNMANINTQGYKREIYLNRAFSQLMATPTEQAATTMQPNVDAPAAAPTVTRDYSAAPLKYTGSTLNIAIEGDGYFQLRSPQGLVLTRNGQFQINPRGQLVSAQGWPVVLKGDIAFDNTDFKIAGDGSILVAGQRQSQLDLVTADPKALEMIGPGMFKAATTAPFAPTTAYVRQGYIEGSNVDSLSEMINLITVTRHVESSQQLIRAYDEVLGGAITTLGEF